MSKYRRSGSTEELPLFSGAGSEPERQPNEKRAEVLAKLRDVAPKYHRDGPITERTATRHLDNATALLKVLVFVVSRGERGATSDEARRWYNPSSNTGRVRLNQLKDLGLVVAQERTRETVNGRPAQVHVASPEAVEAFGPPG